MRINVRPLIIGLICVTGLLVRAGDALALYSPRLSRGVSAIRQDVNSSRAQNGSQSVLEEVESIKAYDRASRENKEATGIPGDVNVAQEMILNSINIYKPYDTLAMIFNYNYVNDEIVSTCLRDDIWQLETIRDIVGSEMLKAYMLRDTYHGDILARDYAYLTDNIDLLRKYGSNPQAKILVQNQNYFYGISSKEYFFGGDPPAEGELNYYSNADPILGYGQTTCPEGEFERAITEVVNSYKNITNTVGGNSLFSLERWGDLMAMARANARSRARQWIRANEIGLTLGGEEGGNVESLIKRDGLNRFVGSIKTQWQILKNMVGPVTPFFDKKSYTAPPGTQAAEAALNSRTGQDCVYYYHEDGTFRDCLENQLEEYNRCKDDRQEAEERYGIDCDRYRNKNEIVSASDLLRRQQAMMEENANTMEDVETAFSYSLTFDSVGENNLYAMDDVLWDMNMQIQRGYEDVGDEDDKAVPTINRGVKTLLDKQCVNRNQ